ncbi:hypothetical protein G6F19_013146 [Rhizopus arrhizus]|nr:hypothetical protein G6F19_013146 [Rhizopus arrhizus]
MQTAIAPMTVKDRITKHWDSFGSHCNPQSNGLIERFNRTLGQILQRRSEDEKKDWDLYLSAALFAYRSIKQATTKQSPFFLTYGYEPKTPFDMKHHLYDRKSPKFEATLYHRTSHQIHNLNRIREQAASAIKTTQVAQRKAIENKILDQRKELKPPFKLGELVLLYKDYLSTSWHLPHQTYGCTRYPD